MVRVLFSTLLFAVALASQAGAQAQITLQTSEGDISIEASTHPDLTEFVNLFFVSQKPVPAGSFFHASDKLLACDEMTCGCSLYDCASCADGSDPDLLCMDGAPPTCTCADMSAPAYSCTMPDGVEFLCANLESPSCTCDDGSSSSFECSDFSPPPGACEPDSFFVTDQTMRAGALHAGRHRLNADDEVVDLPNFITTPAMQTAPGLFQNDAFTVAFVRDPGTCLLTSEWIINIDDNSREYDDLAGCEGPNEGDGGYLVFARVIGIGPLDTIARLPTEDLTAEVLDEQVQETALSCVDDDLQSPLTTWITGIQEESRCPGWETFPLIDLSQEPVPQVLGNCTPGDPDCMCPAGAPCEERDLPLCASVGPSVDDGEGGTFDPCLEPLCTDTMVRPDPMDPMGAMETVCTEALEPNFPVVIPEPGAALLAAAALALVAGLRRARNHR